MSLDRCGTCGEWLFSHKPHRCPPVWEWRQKDGTDDDWSTLYAHGCHEAAKMAAEAYDVDDYPLLKGGDVVILLRRKGEDHFTIWRCTGESVPSYSANEIAA